MRFQDLKHLFLKIMLGCLIAAAAVAVVSILMGSFNEVTARALMTILLVAIHCLLAFAFIANNEKQETFENLTFFTNVTFIIIILSFLTSVLGTWDVISGSVVGKMYAFYAVLLFATLHGEMLAKMFDLEALMTNLIIANYVFMVLVVIMLMPIIFFDNANLVLGDFYYRLLAACGVIDATLTMSVIILYKMYLRKHPDFLDRVFTPVNHVQPVTTPAATVINPGTPGTPATVAAPGTTAAPGTPAVAPAQTVVVQAQPRRSSALSIVGGLFLAFLALQFLGGIVFMLMGARSL